jgi:hypothetical protein
MDDAVFSSLSPHRVFFSPSLTCTHFYVRFYCTLVPVAACNHVLVIDLKSENCRDDIKIVFKEKKVSLMFLPIFFQTNSMN